MVIHFELHPSWTQSLLFGDAIRAGVSLGKDNHWHFQGVTGLWVISGGFLIIEIIEKPCDIEPSLIRVTIRQIQARLMQQRKSKNGK
jgi:hypothetical protein